MHGSRSRRGAARSMLAVTAALLAIGALLAGCASGGKPKPQPLEPLTAKIAGAPAWNQHISGVDFPLAVAVVKNRFIVAATDGTVLALEADTGREAWRGAAGAKLSAGVGSDGRMSAVVTRDGELVVFDQGAVKWRKALGVRVSTAPLVAGERVFVVGVDRAVQAFDAETGRKLWVMQRPGDPLTLAQGGVLSAFQDTLIVGQGPRMAGVDPNRGQIRWETPVGSPRGANEIERLADLVGPAARVGDTVCARSFQAAVGCVDAVHGTTLWSKNIGGIDAIAADADFVFAADANDRITAWKLNGDAAWTSDRLQYRDVSAPLSVGKTVVFGDAEGLLHFFARDSGEALLRLSTDGSPIVAQPVVSGTVMLAVTKKGGLYAFKP